MSGDRPLSSSTALGSKRGRSNGAVAVQLPASAMRLLHGRMYAIASEHKQRRVSQPGGGKAGKRRTALTRRGVGGKRTARWEGREEPRVPRTKGGERGDHGFGIPAY